MEKNKLTEVLDLGLDVIRSGRLFGLVSPADARKSATLSFIGGALLGGGIATVLMMRGDAASMLRDRVGQIRGDVMSRVGDLKEKVTGGGQHAQEKSQPMTPPRAS